MRYYIPDVRVPIERPAKPTLASVAGRLFGGRVEVHAPAPGSSERLGGVPAGLLPDQWPRCRDCGKSQSLLAQLDHHPDRLDLGREGRVLFIFQCEHDPGMCATWEAFSGANACFVVEPETLVAEETKAPVDAPPVLPHVNILDWVSRDDGIAASFADAFQTEQAYLEVPEDVLSKVTWSTRLGGLPRWLQSADEGPRPAWNFIGQLDGTYSFLSPPKPLPPWINVDKERWEGRTHVGIGPNFGGGLAYLFLKYGDGCPEGCMFWQR